MRTQENITTNNIFYNFKTNYHTQKYISSPTWLRPDYTKGLCLYERPNFENRDIYKSKCSNLYIQTESEVCTNTESGSDYFQNKNPDPQPCCKPSLRPEVTELVIWIDISIHFPCKKGRTKIHNDSIKEQSESGYLYKVVTQKYVGKWDLGYSIC